MNGGYTGKILRVNLTDRTVSVAPTEADLARNYVGARGFIAYTLYKELPPGVDPLSPEAKFVAATGPLTGLFIPSSGKIQSGCKSPATGGYGESNSGGHFPEELKMAGYDMLILEGAADRPSAIVIDDDAVRIEDARDLWGKGCIDTEVALKKSLGHNFQIMTIGPAGERLVKFACLTHDFGRQAGRCGLGAVLGSKKVKAICVRGTHAIPCRDVDRLVAHGRKMYEKCFTSPAYELWQTYGTASTTVWANRVGAFPTRNFQSGYFERFENLSAQKMREEIVVNNKACFACAMCCGKYSHAKSAAYDVYVEGPEYETTAMIGGMCALGNIKDVAYANYLCDDYGLDTISAGNAAAFAIECFERGIIKEKETGGLRLRFGDAACVFVLLKMMALREGIGDLLAEGVKKSAEVLGHDSIKFAMQAKGLEQSGYESRRAPAMQLSYMTSDVGSHHRPSWAITFDIAEGRETTEGKAARVIELQHLRPLFDTLGVCRFPWLELGLPMADYAEAFRIATGIDYDEKELMRVSERIWNLTRMFWLREVEGFGRSWDMPPARVYEEAVKEGPTKGAVLEEAKIETLLDDYYRLRGWSRDGVPTEGKLRELGLGWVLGDRK